MLLLCVSQIPISPAPEAFGLHSAFCRTVAHWGWRLQNCATMKLNLVGKRFGRLRVLRASKKRSSSHGMRWECLCECGNNTTVSSTHLITGHTKSCGCYRRDSSALSLYKHGESAGGLSPEYRAWSQAKNRCLNQNNKRWKRYGGRGVIFCERWKNSFENFLEDMGRRPPKTSLERKDNNGNYEPGNCKWATKVEQANNKSNNRTITVNGKTQTLAAWEREMGYRKGTITARLYAGFAPERAVLQPVRLFHRDRNT